MFYVKVSEHVHIVNFVPFVINGERLNVAFGDFYAFNLLIGYSSAIFIW